MSEHTVLVIHEGWVDQAGRLVVTPAELIDALSLQCFTNHRRNTKEVLPVLLGFLSLRVERVLFKDLLQHVVNFVSGTNLISVLQNKQLF